MHIIKWLNQKIVGFFNAIDTITTKLLMLVLCCITIPLIVVATFSTDVINDSIVQNAKMRLNINKKIFDKKYSDELNKLGVLLNTSIEDYLDHNKNLYPNKTKKISNYIFSKNKELSFIAIIDPNKNIADYKGNIDSSLVIDKLEKLIKISIAEENLLSTENIDNKLYQIAIKSVYDEGRLLATVVIGKTLESNETIPYTNKITGATILIYNQLENQNSVELISSSEQETEFDNHFINVNNNELVDKEKEQGFYFDGAELLNNDYFSQKFSLYNYMNMPVGSVFVGVPKFGFIVWVDKNAKLISFIAIISLIVAITIAALFARKITDPILALKEAAESINLGDLNYKVEIKGNDETVKLSNAFNEMVNNLEKEERLRNNFVATLTHDLKVPMLAENQTIKFLLNETYGPLTDDQKEVLDLMRSTNNSSLEMIGTLLEVYRYDCGNVQLFETEFDLVELLKESVNQIKSLADEKKIQINIESSQEIVNIYADKRDIKRLIHNIVSNGINHGIHRGYINCKIDVINDTIKYIPNANTENYTSLKKAINIENGVLISIQDNGVGISREDMPLLFNRFSLSKGRKPAGSGLGLYYASQVLAAHKGKIWVESSEKGGTTFKFTLPLKG